MLQARLAVAGPSRKVLGGLVLLALLLHLALLLGVEAPLDVRLAASQTPRPVHMRVLPPPAPEVRAAPKPAPRRVLAATAPTTTIPASVSTEPPAESPPAAPVPEPQASAPVLAQAAADESAASEPAPAKAPVQTSTSAALSADDETTAWPLVPLGALPSSRVLSYQLHGMDKGLRYFANGELRWQHNTRDYELTLSVRAFLLGRRSWRSVGQIGPTGLAPRRFSDSWRNERASHFDREQQRVVFSSNSQPAPLQAGAQDQVSLYMQLAVAMAGEPERFVPGTRLQVQTATVSSAQAWSLVLEGSEALTLDGQSVNAMKWVAQPRNRFDSRVEFWVTAAQAWLPVRILITQTSGSYIDLLWRSTEPLAPLASDGNATPAATGS